MVSMFRFSLISAFSILIIFSGPAAAGDVVIGDTCTNLGTSVMTSDQKNIAVCLKDDDGSKVWKGMTSSSSSSVPEGVWCGFATYTTKSSYKDSGGGRWSTILSAVKSYEECENVTLLTKSKSGWDIVKACPTNYTMRCYTAVNGSSGDQSHYNYYLCTCIK